MTEAECLDWNKGIQFTFTKLHNYDFNACWMFVHGNNIIIQIQRKVTVYQDMLQVENLQIASKGPGGAGYTKYCPDV